MGMRLGRVGAGWVVVGEGGWNGVESVAITELLEWSGVDSCKGLC